jgi:hypothetical protein
MPTAGRTVDPADLNRYRSTQLPNEGRTAAAALLWRLPALRRGAELFPLADVRLVRQAPSWTPRTTDLQLPAGAGAGPPAGALPARSRPAAAQPSYGNWESSGLDGHMGGHYLSALALMYASTGDAEVLRRLNYFVAELKRCQQANGNGYLGGIPAAPAPGAPSRKASCKPTTSRSTANGSRGTTCTRSTPACATPTAMPATRTRAPC